MEVNNKLIAEFMQKGFEGFGIYDFDGCHYRLDELKFHSSWDWLMPVIIKIADIRKDTHYKLYKTIDKAHEEVVEFIKNQNK